MARKLVNPRITGSSNRPTRERALMAPDPEMMGVTTRVRRRCGDLGAVYTPQVLADWMAKLLLRLVDARHPTVFDPACGDGSLLRAVARQRDAGLIGVDYDRDAVSAASDQLPSAILSCTDGLAHLASSFSKGEHLPADGIIANPPWGARLPANRESLQSMGYEFVSGQVDSWDLFVEGIVRAAKMAAAIVLILPDSLFLPEHKRTRELLSTACTIEVLARLGEGLFEGIYRGCVVIALRKGGAPINHLVSCLRLTPESRKEVLANRACLDELLNANSHRVAQSAFSQDAQFRFSLDTFHDEGPRIDKLERFSFPWTDWTTSGRGIELSKSGRILRCPECGYAKPAPRHPSPTECLECGREWKPSEEEVETIVSRGVLVKRGKAWHPLIVGADVHRHTCNPSSQIRMDVPGIRYKPLSQFRARKLLIRKTGVGIKAAVDESGAATTQVVFHYLAKNNAPDYLLDYLQGVLCSRTLLAWHLKRNGDSEWRSHPYVTQSMIQNFPIPFPRSTGDIAQAQAIAAAVAARRRRSRHDSLEDFEVERLVAGMFRYTASDMRWTLNVLDAAQQLEPIRTMRVPSIDAVMPVQVLAASSRKPVNPRRANKRGC